MNIFGKVTRRTLCKNRTRTIVTVIGILLSAAMFTAVMVSVSSLLNYMKECAIYTVGDWHGSFLNVPSDQMESLENDGKIDSIAWAQNVGYADAGSTNDYKPYLFVMGIDSLFGERMPIHLTEGRMPDNSQEILLPEHLLYNGGVKHALGERLTLELGNRYWDTEKLSQGVGYMPEEEDSKGEELKIQETRTYTVVGFYERPDFENFSSPGYTAITLWDDDRPAQDAAAYFRMENPKEVFNFITAGAETYGIGSQNFNLLRFEGASRYDSYYTVLYGMASILFLLIMFGSVSLIYNAFSISVSERTRQFGLLSSVGATKKQIRKMVFSEAAYVSLIGIPLGVLSGIVGMGITFHFIGNKFYAFYGVKEVTLKLVISPVSLLIAVLAAYLTVLISAWIPSYRAVRVSAIEAIRQSEDIRIKPRQVKTSAGTFKLFGLEGMLAKKHFKRNKRRYRATVLSLFASVVLFISASSYCSYFTDMITGVYEDCDYDIKYEWGDVRQDRKDELSLEQGATILGQTEGVTKYSYVMAIGTELELSADMVPEETQKTLFGTEESGQSSNVNTYIAIYGVDSKTYDNYLKELNLDASLYHDDSRPLGIVKATGEEFNKEAGRYEQVRLLRPELKKLSVGVLDKEKWDEYLDSSEADHASEEEVEAKRRECLHNLELKIGTFAENLPFGLNDDNPYRIVITYPLEVFQKIMPNSYISQRIYFKTTDHVKGMENLEKTADENRFPKEFFYDVYASSEHDRNMVTIINVFAYGFIVLISLISVANVFNTISTSILLRRREFAMLKSVGMTERGVSKMLMYECLLYGIKSLAYGIPVSFVITYLIFKSVGAGYEMDFYLPWQSVGIAVCSVFMVVFSTMLYARERVKKDNLIDVLKNENY